MPFGFSGRLPLAQAALCVVALSGCGGGGGGSATLSALRLDTSRFETSEYAAQEGLRLIRASSVYARGGAGRGVTVAVFDSGANPNHPDLAGKYAYTGAATGLSAIDTANGHGVHVGGIIAAWRNDAGMHGVAFDARLASYATNDAAGSVVVTDAQLAGAIDGMRGRGALISNSSWGAVSAITARTRSDIETEYANSLPAWRRYVAAGGVQVWSTGNFGTGQVSVEAGMPYRFSELTNGWLAVMAVDLDGYEASYTDRCGVAAAWCLAAPGGDRPALGGRPGTQGVYSTVLGSGYGRKSGTSFAAPHVAGALAALKSLFPSLSYQALRARLLTTANDRGRYANSAIYGHGLLDLDAASRPVGGTSFALGTRASGPVTTTAGASVRLPRGAAARWLAGRRILVLDNYQRAPFQVPLGTFASPASPYLSLADLALAAPQRRWEERNGTATLAVAGDGFRAGGASNGVWFVGSSRGARAMEGMARLIGAPLPRGDYRMGTDAFGATLGLAAGGGEFYAGVAAGGADPDAAGFGVAGWGPEAVATATFVTDGGGEAFGASAASSLRRPLGWAGSGALALSGDSFDLAWARRLASGETWRLGLAGRLTHLALKAGPLTRFDDALTASADLDLALDLGSGTTLALRLGAERAAAPVSGSIRAAARIDENGRIGYDDLRIDGSDLLAFDRIGLRLARAWGPDALLGLGAMAVRDGFGRTEAIAGVRVELRF